MVDYHIVDVVFFGIILMIYVNVLSYMINQKQELENEFQIQMCKKGLARGIAEDRRVIQSMNTWAR